MANKRISDTQEINSILEEARKNRETHTEQTAPIREVNPIQIKKTVIPSQDPEDDYIFDNSFADEDAVDISAAASKKQKKQQRKTQTQDPQPPKKKSKTGLIVALVILGVVVLAVIGGVTWYMLSGSSVMADNITVSGVSLAGMSLDEAKKALAPVESAMADTIKVDVSGPNNKAMTLTKDDFKYTFNTDEILKDAQAYSEQKGVKSGAKEYTITMTMDQQSCQAAAEKVAKDFNAEAKNARVATYDSEGDGTFTYEDDVLGVSIKTAELAQSLASVIKEKPTATLQAPFEEVKAKYTKEYLQKNIRQLSSFTTTSTNSSNGNHNMATSLDACDGSIIEPDATWSFNACTGDSNKTSNGYLPAGVIVEGRHETGVGGGICQSSTTIYNAALLCGMEVEERSCHYYKSTYVDAGRDATVDYGNLDLKMSNPFDTQLFMKCYMDGVVLHCEMYGVPQDDFDKIEITTATSSTFSNGYKVAAERHYLKGDKEVRSEELPNSTYYTSAPSSGSSGSNDDDDDDDDDDEGSSGGSSSDSGSSDSGSSSDGGSSSDSGSSSEGSSSEGSSSEGGSSSDSGSSDSNNTDNGANEG